MESAKVYTPAEIEKIEQEVVAYQNLLTTLKLGASLEDYLSIKDEFEELKKQMEHVESVEDVINQSPPEQIEPQHNEVQQVSVQLASLNRMVEEVLATLNKVVTGEVKKEQVEEAPAPHTILPINEAKQHEQQVNQSINEPTYHQLRKLAGQSSDYQKMKELPTLIEHTKNQLTTQQQQRHFNVRYFQSTQTQPSNMYNGLYKNMRINVSSKLKNIGQMRMDGVMNQSIVQPSLSRFLKHPNIGPVISNEIPTSIMKNNQLE